MVALDNSSRISPRTNTKVGLGASRSTCGSGASPPPPLPDAIRFAINLVLNAGPVLQAFQMLLSLNHEALHLSLLLSEMGNASAVT